MGHGAAEAAEKLEEARHSRGGKWTGVYIALLAVILAVTNMGASNALKDMLFYNTEAANLWAFFQAKTIRKTTVETEAETLKAILAANPNMGEDAKKQVQTAIARHAANAARYESDPKDNDGRRELMARAKKAEEARDKAQRKDPYFDFAEALIQIAIVLASVTLITGTRALLLLSILMGSLGAFLSFNGFTLLMKIGFLEH
jgi:hypothetical protein